jgi:LysM repeat protein
MLTFLSILFLSAFSIEAASLTKRDTATNVKGLGKAKSLSKRKKSCTGAGQTFMMVNYKTTLANNPKFNPQSKCVCYKLSPIKDKAKYYIVQEDDYLWKIAEEFAPTYDASKAVDDIVQLNGIINPDEIYDGQPLRFPEYFTIPEKDERFQVLGQASKKSYYMVQPGDWLEKIAVLLAPGRGPDTAVDDLVDLNKIEDPDMILDGQLLALPTGFARLSNGKTFVEIVSCSK